VPAQRRVESLEPSPRAATRARRWLAAVCRDMGREDLVECAELAVTELVSNAVLHAVPSIAVAVRGTRTHPRVDVHDGLTTLPEPPVLAGDDPDDLLATVGRGLAIVARASVAWGARAEPGGKVVWFEPASDVRDEAAQPHLDERLIPEPAPAADQVPVVLRGLDPRLHRSVTRHSHELRRELRLLALAHESDYPVAANLSATWHEIEQLLHQEPWSLVSLAQDAALERTDVVVEVPPGSGPTFDKMAEMLDLADQFCRDERLLALQRTPLQRSYHGWLLAEFARQLDGADPRPWDGSGTAPGLPAR